MGGLLRLADGGKQSQIKGPRGTAFQPSALSRKGRSHSLFLCFGWARFDAPLFLLAFFPAVFAATIS